MSYWVEKKKRPWVFPSLSLFLRRQYTQFWGRCECDGFEVDLGSHLPPLREDLVCAVYSCQLPMLGIFSLCLHANTCKHKQGLHKHHKQVITIIIIMYIYHALINALSAHMICINLNTIFYTHVEHTPTKTIYMRHYMETHTETHTHTTTHIHYHTHTHTTTHTHSQTHTLPHTHTHTHTHIHWHTHTHKHILPPPHTHVMTNHEWKRATYLFGEFLPGFLQPVDRAVDKGSTDLQHTVVVVHAAADVCDGGPLLDAGHSISHVAATNNLRHHQATHLPLEKYCYS